jgi:hypothetical protein
MAGWKQADLTGLPMDCYVKDYLTTDVPCAPDR